MPTVSLITTCKGRLHHLKQTINQFLKQQILEIIVIDYGCPNNTYKWCESLNNNIIKCAVTASINDEFNISRARNIGARVASGNILFFVDADNILPDQFVANGLTIISERQLDLCCPGIDNLVSGTCFVKSHVWYTMNGYDENMTGWGYDDIDFYNRVEMAGFSYGIWNNNGLKIIQHPDHESTQYYTIKDKRESAAINEKILFNRTRTINDNGFGISLINMI